MEAMDAAGHIQWQQAEWRGTCNFCYGYIEHIGIPIDAAPIATSPHGARTSRSP